MELRTQRLRLRPYEPRDFETVFRDLVLDPDVVQLWPDFMAPGLSVADKRAMAQRDLGAWIEEGIAAGLPAWIAEAAAMAAGPEDDFAAGPEGDFVGAVGVFPSQNEWGPEPEVGCLLASRHHGRGLGTEALGAVVADAVARLGIPVLVAIVDEPNAASIRMVEKCGFSLERSYPGDDGQPCRRYVLRAAGAASR
jgi:RimJ/RimL family protein N-acetyltransferase